MKITLDEQEAERALDALLWTNLTRSSIADEERARSHKLIARLEAVVAPAGEFADDGIGDASIAPGIAG